MDLLEIAALYVEDDALTREVVSRMLERRVKTLYQAENGKAGLALFRERAPDIVITDIKMPLMNGLEMAREMKAINGNSPVIVTTAHNDNEYLLQAIDIGIDQFVLKPVQAESLYAAVNKCAMAVLYERETRKRNAEREKLVCELQEALEKVKLLSGFLPICASCKKIRDDRGYWQQIEAYITDHSNAVFTHSLCADCVRKLYPDLRTE